ncbi:hypothetical protein ATJ88_0583 [Isoptericola jiangsuensis]|uniref:Uncharacterized protein n=1 Tax=Isoptericola jiangsuensis TaxID=548579 RepID=A0A2A9ESE7_9MICO|nr:hypothetical protein [Isoptericola jiangsuensis]PFG41934.1 hypothetical protein ATJ88_0583 [Isoptericola jiangsuensis]
MNAELETRLARLAPASSPDPRGLDAARGRVDAVIEGRAGMPAPEDGPTETFSPDVVVPLAPSVRRRRAALVAAAAVAAVLVGGVVVPTLVVPRVLDAGTRAVIDGCTTDLPGATTLAAGRVDGEVLALLRSGEWLVFCTAGGHSSLAPAEDPWVPPADGRVDVIGTMLSTLDDDTMEVAEIGQVGAGVESVEVVTSTGRTVEAVVADGYWVALYLAAEDKSAQTVTWTLDDGTVRTGTVESLAK